MKTFFAVLFSLLFVQSHFSLAAEKVYFFDCSASVFRGSEGKDIVEMYYAVTQRFLKYTPDGKSGYAADVKLDVFIFEKNSDKPLAANSYKVPSVIKDTTDEKMKNKIVGQINYEMKYGDYRFLVIASDFNNPDMKDSAEIQITAKDFSGTPKLSDVELSTSILKSSDTKSLFYKNTLEVIPNAASLYGTNLGQLYYYSEIYNLEPEKISEEYVIKKRILSTNNEELYLSEKKAKRTGNSKVEYGMLSVDTLPTGSYVFELSLIDPSKNVNVTETKKFFVYTKSDVVVNSDIGQGDFLKSEYTILNEKDLDDMFDKIIYIRTDEEAKTYRQLTDIDSKRKFMYDFWRLRDNIPGTSQNEFKVAFFKRMQEANKQFKEDYNEGWKTDRGRIYLLYGAPSELRLYPFERDKKSYQVWIFDALQGGTSAIFIEKDTGTGVYKLEHSTIRGEFQNPNWEAELEHFK